MAGSMSPGKLAREFRKDFPDTPLKQIRWFRRRLGIDEKRLIRLFDLPSGKSQSLEAAVADNPEATTRVIELFHELVAMFNYDTKKLSEALHRPPNEQIPHGLTDSTLLNQIVVGGPGVMTHLFRYLQSVNATTGATQS
jgi:hypothetical protein